MTTSNLRQWQITAGSAHSLRLAADARLSLTDYRDDQVWDVELGTGDSAAFALHTKYGWRVGLASLVPMWIHEGRVIYQAQTYQDAARITAFAPNYIKVDAQLLPAVLLEAEHFAFDSHTLAGLYTLKNSSDKDIKIRFDLFGHLGARGREQKLAIISMASGGHALALGAIPTIAPVVLIENGQASDLGSRSASPKIGVTVTIPANSEQVIRWVHVGLSDIRQSLEMAQTWFKADWDAFRASIDAAASAIPTIQTGNLEWDAVIASSYNQALQAVLRPAGIFPRETLVAARLPETGYSQRGDGSDHPRTWNGQDVLLTYMLAPIIASIYPTAAEGIIRNYIAMQQQDGNIDLKPGAAGQKAQLLCTPILATTTWHIYEQTQHIDFVRDSFEPLSRFFEHWLTQDADGDGFPEWADDRQTGYVAFPTFSPSRSWSQGATINTAETPDLLTYLIVEAASLQKMADLLDDKSASNRFADHKAKLIKHLESSWTGTHYAYHDRDTNITTSGMVLLEDGIGDIEHLLERDLAAPNRLIVKVIGGVRHVPNVTLHIHGTDNNGNDVHETVAAAEMLWQNRQGVFYTTQAVFSHVAKVYCDGLSRVYRVDVRTMDTTEIDINALLPLWSGAIPKSNAQVLTKLAVSKRRFMRPNGVTMCDSSSDYFDPSNAEGAGGLWLYWLALIGEGMIKVGQGKAATEIMKTLLKLLQDILQQDHEFAQFYHSDKLQGLGEKGHSAGMVPLYLLQQLFGVRVLSPSKVWLDKSFEWRRSVTIRQHGVYIRRTNKRIKVEFPSGYTVELKPKLAESVLIEDENPVILPEPEQIRLPEPTKVTIPVEQEPEQTTRRVIIDVEFEE